MNITNNHIVTTESIFGRNVSKLCQSMESKFFTPFLGGGKNCLQELLISFDNANVLNLQDINGVNGAPSGKIYFYADGVIFVSLSESSYE